MRSNRFYYLFNHIILIFIIFLGGSNQSFALRRSKPDYKPAKVIYKPPKLSNLVSPQPVRLSNNFTWHFPEELKKLFRYENQLHTPQTCPNPDHTMLDKAVKQIRSLDPKSRIKAVHFIGKSLVRIVRTRPYNAGSIHDYFPVFRRNNVYLLSRIGEPAVEMLTGWLKTTSEVDWEARVGAAEALGLMGPSAIEPLINVLNHKSPPVRIRAAAALVQIGDPGYFDQVIGSVAQYSSENIEIYSNSTEDQKKQNIINRFISMLKHKEQQVRVNAAWALGYIGVNKAVEPLISYLNQAEKWDILFAADALSHIRDHRSVSALISKLKRLKKKYPGPQLSYVFETALARMGDPAIEPLIDLLNDTGQKVYSGGNKPVYSTKYYYYGPRVAAARALAWIEMGKTGNKKCLVPLLNVLKQPGKNFKFRGMRIEAAKALGWLSDPKAVDPLINALKDDGPMVRASSAWALGKLGDERAIDPLLALLDDKNSTVVLTSLNALGSFGNQKVVDRIFRYNEQQWKNSLSMLSTSLLSLKKMGPDIGEYLTSKIKNWEPRSNLHKSNLHNFAALLGIRKEKKAIEWFSEMLIKGKKLVREVAAWSLGYIGDKKAVPSLVHALKDKKSDVRINVAWALGNIGDPSAIDPLVKTFQNSKEKLQVRQNAVWAVAMIGNSKAVPALIEQLDELDLGKIAHWSLIKLSGKDFGFGTSEAKDSWKQWYKEKTAE